MNTQNTYEWGYYCYFFRLINIDALALPPRPVINDVITVKKLSSYSAA